MRLRWIHIIPLVHLLVCLLAASGYVLPPFRPLAILFSVLLLADFPVSVIFAFLAFGTHGAIAFVYLLVAGTLWWYLLCRIAEKASAALKRKRGLLS